MTHIKSKIFSCLLAMAVLLPSAAYCATNKLDLQIMLNGTDPCTAGMQTLNIRFRVYNWETSAISANTLKVEGYINAGVGVQSNTCGQITAFTSGGVWSGQVGTACSVASVASCVYNAGRTANQKVVMTLGAINIPANGGYVESDGMIFNLSTWSSPFDAGCDDYSKPGAASWHSDAYWGLFQNSPGPTLVCEYANASTPDASSGSEACSGMNACVTPTPTRTPSPTATRTPSLPLVKSANVATANVGSTITYCVAWTNDSSASMTRTFYDNLDSHLTFLGGQAGCSAAGQLVTCSFTAPVGSGSKCFWVTVNSSP